MSELIIYKANELAISRYDLTEHETKLILCCVSKLNPELEPTDENRTVIFNVHEYAKIMGISNENAWGRLKASTRSLFKRSVEIFNHELQEIQIFNWVEFAKFSNKTQTLELIFSKQILPYLFNLKKFIKYNLNHVKQFKNKYSMRVYEWLLKELTQRKTNQAQIKITIDDFKFMLLIEKKYREFQNFKVRVLNKIIIDINQYSNFKINVFAKGKPVQFLIFDCQLDIQNNAIEIEKNGKKEVVAELNKDEIYYKKIIALINLFEVEAIQLTKKEYDFLMMLKVDFDKNKSFKLTNKQSEFLDSIIKKYLK